MEEKNWCLILRGNNGQFLEGGGMLKFSVFRNKVINKKRRMEAAGEERTRYIDILFIKNTVPVRAEKRGCYED